MSKLLFGYGYLGLRVANLWRDAGDTVHIVTRSARRAASLQNAGYQTTVADVTQPDTLQNLPPAETVLFAVGYDRTQTDSIHTVYAGGVQNVLAALPASVKQFIYISTTGVYGASGDWVDELTPPNPQRDGGRASLAAEKLLGENSVILRLAGIYGPGRIPYLDKLRAGQPIAAPSKGWLNLIHVDDAASIVLAAESWAAEGQAAGPHLFCVSDGQPVVRGDYYCEVARRIGAPEPQFVEPHPTSPAAARAAADKRICNKKMLSTLKPHLAYAKAWRAFWLTRSTPAICQIAANPPVRSRLAFY
ncbi:MAG: SDR family oxidoreductase [Planctomycetes bacterium]|nr:SDR family oxidoreductase [Planctomycetota bacterium]